MTQWKKKTLEIANAIHLKSKLLRHYCQSKEDTEGVIRNFRKCKLPTINSS
jgi:hypothetical protein